MENHDNYESDWPLSNIREKLHGEFWSVGYTSWVLSNQELVHFLVHFVQTILDDKKLPPPSEMGTAFRSYNKRTELNCLTHHRCEASPETIKPEAQGLSSEPVRYFLPAVVR